MKSVLPGKDYSLTLFRDDLDPAWGDRLTPRECEVARLIVAEHLSNPEIAARLSIGRQTVKTHVARILAKQGVPRRESIRDPGLADG